MVKLAGRLHVKPNPGQAHWPELREWLGFDDFLVRSGKHLKRSDSS